jgi:hypothetical protein
MVVLAILVSIPVTEIGGSLRYRPNYCCKGFRPGKTKVFDAGWLSTPKTKRSIQINKSFRSLYIVSVMSEYIVYYSHATGEQLAVGQALQGHPGYAALVLLPVQQTL